MQNFRDRKTAVNDGKDQINYPTDSVCQKLYDQYQSMNVEEFKSWFYGRIFGETEE